MMRWLSPTRRLATIWLASLIACTPAIAAPKAQHIAEYRVSYSGGDEFRVDARFRAPTSKLTLYSFPTDKNPLGQAAFIDSLKAWDAAGRELVLTYDREGNWTAAEPIARAKYVVAARHDRQSWGGPGKDEVATHFDNTF